MTIQLRDYQQDAIAAVYEHLRTRADNPCVVIPTAGGKTPILAQICRDAARWGRRALVLTHVKELVAQAADKLHTMAPDLPVGIYSAGLGRRDLNRDITLAGIQSIHRKAYDLGRIDIAIVDEAHLIPPKGEGMYRSFFEAARTVNPKMRIVGLTATPYRTESGMICSETNILNHICYEVGIHDLLERGFLSPLKSRSGSVVVDTSKIEVKRGEFTTRGMTAAYDAEGTVEDTCSDIMERTRDRKSVLVFASSVVHGRHIADCLSESCEGVEFVDGKTHARDRDEIARRFVAGQIKYLVNVNVFTTGFDAPNVDCVVLLRPTMSPGLYYQMVGRGFRIAPGKADCLVLDYGQNVIRHGPVDCIVPEPTGKYGDNKDVYSKKNAKECPGRYSGGGTAGKYDSDHICGNLVHIDEWRCGECGHIFTETKHTEEPDDVEILSEKKQSIIDTIDVYQEFYSAHKKKGASAYHPDTMRVDYEFYMGQRRSEFLCFGHPPASYARQKAELWWRARSNAPVPASVEEAVSLAAGGALAKTLRIVTRLKPGEKYPEIVSHHLGDKPESWEAVDLNAPEPEPATVEWDEDMPI